MEHKLVSQSDRPLGEHSMQTAIVRKLERGRAYLFMGGLCEGKKKLCARDLEVCCYCCGRTDLGSRQLLSTFKECAVLTLIQE